jgi:hypothetical protein
VSEEEPIEHLKLGEWHLKLGEWKALPGWNSEGSELELMMDYAKSAYLQFGEEVSCTIYPGDEISAPNGILQVKRAATGETEIIGRGEMVGHMMRFFPIEQDDYDENHRQEVS